MVPETGNGNQEGRMKNSGRVSQVAFVTLPQKLLSTNFMSNEEVKLVVCGDGAVGKTCLLTRYTRNSFPDSYVPTVFENQIVSILIDEKPIQVEAVDTAGQEGYDGVRAMSYPGTDIFLVCFSADSADSMHNVEEKWIPELLREMGKGHEEGWKILLCCNKSDLIGTDHAPDYDRGEADAMAKRIGAVNNQVFECSALADEGVGELFEAGIRAALEGGGASGGCCVLQ